MLSEGRGAGGATYNLGGRVGGKGGGRKGRDTLRAGKAKEGQWGLSRNQKKRKMKNKPKKEIGRKEVQTGVGKTD